MSRDSPPPREAVGRGQGWGLFIAACYDALNVGAHYDTKGEHEFVAPAVPPPPTPPHRSQELAGGGEPPAFWLSAMIRRLTRPLWLLLALLFLFEAWLWERLAPIVARVVRLIAWRELRARVAASIEHLPPYATLLVFLIPVVLLLPIKLLGFWMLAHGFWLGAMATLGLAKVVSMGVTAFIFDVTRPKLLQLPWFRWLYEHMLTWLGWAHALIDPIKQEMRAWLRARLRPVRRRLASLVWLMKPKRAGRFLRRVVRIRRRMQARERAQPA